MNDPLTLPWTLSLAAGALLGALFFGGLWWTIRKAFSSPQPGIWILGSLMLRMSITLTGFYYVSDGHWDRLLLCLLGFVIARFLVSWLTRPSDEKQNNSVQRAGHAP